MLIAMQMLLQTHISITHSLGRLYIQVMNKHILDIQSSKHMILGNNKWLRTTHFPPIVYIVFTKLQYVLP